MDELANLEDEIARLEAELGEKEEEIGKLEARIDDLEGDNYELETEARMLEDDAEESSRILDQTTDELTKYQDIVEIIGDLGLEKGQLYADLVFYRDEYGSEQEREAYEDGFTSAADIILGQMP